MGAAGARLSRTAACPTFQACCGSEEPRSDFHLRLKHYRQLTDWEHSRNVLMLRRNANDADFVNKKRAEHECSALGKMNLCYLRNLREKPARKAKAIPMRPKVKPPSGTRRPFSL